MYHKLLLNLVEDTTQSFFFLIDSKWNQTWNHRKHNCSCISAHTAVYDNLECGWENVVFSLSLSASPAPPECVHKTSDLQDSFPLNNLLTGNYVCCNKKIILQHFIQQSSLRMFNALSTVQSTLK